MRAFDFTNIIEPFMTKSVCVLVGGVVPPCFGQNDWLASPALALTTEPAGLSAPH